MEVGQVPAGVGRTLVPAPGEPWSASQLQPERYAAQRQSLRCDLRKQGGNIRNTTSCQRAEHSQCHQPRISGVVQWVLTTELFPNDTKPCTQGRGPHTPR